MEDKRKTLGGRLVRWTAELVLVFIGVYAAFWLNNYQQHHQEANRRDQILASLERILRQGIESGKINAAHEEQQAAIESYLTCRNHARDICISAWKVYQHETLHSHGAA